VTPVPDEPGRSREDASGGQARDDALLLGRARGGDQAAFASLVAPYRADLQLHCYRMLGSFHDAEDVTQEVLVRAWRHLGGFEGRSSVRTWLYRIATNRCLTHRARGACQLSPGAGFSAPPPNALDVEVTALQPFPDSQLGHPSEPGPEAAFDLAESVNLAFLTAVQLLPARQRAVLLLRDVLGFTAAETADVLDATIPGVNSLLHRARATLEHHRRRGRPVPASSRLDADAERRLLDRYVAAWHACDITALLALLREDALLTMPPLPAAYRGRDAIGQFLRTVPAAGRLDRITLVPVRANCQPAVAAYVQDDEGPGMSAYGIMVLAVDGDHIIEITGFADPALFPVFGLPMRREM
jgi:RNA polymerase sigma-70 factor (TIGR02960 family)